MEIRVKNCGNCPFCVTETNTEGLGYDTVETCNLAHFLKYQDTIIDVYDLFSIDVEENETEIEERPSRPDFCPLTTNIKIINE
jgi:hypothetical protein